VNTCKADATRTLRFALYREAGLDGKAQTASRAAPRALPSRLPSTRLWGAGLLGLPGSMAWWTAADRAIPEPECPRRRRLSFQRRRSVRARASRGACPPASPSGVSGRVA